jgi:hypothetical protein
MRFILDSILASRGSKRLSDITNEARLTRDLLDQLDEDESANALSALRFAANGDTVRLGRHDLVITGPNNFVVAECKSFRDLPGDAALGGSDGERRRPDTMIADEEAGVHWRALPVYAQRPFTSEACCVRAVPALAPGVVVGPLVPAATAKPEDEWACILLYIHAEYPPRVRLRVTTQNRRLVRDHREGLRRFLSGVLILLQFMVVTLLTALSHLARTPSFLLVMLATARRYGRRGDGDCHLMSAPTWHPRQRWGATRLAT